MAESLESTDLQRQRAEWRRKSWTVPDLRGGKQAWFSLVSKLVALIGAGQVAELDAYPDISNPQPWRVYASFLRWAGLANIKQGRLVLSDLGSAFQRNPTKKQLADILQERVRLFVEILNTLDPTPSTVKEVDERVCRTYGLNWADLSNTRKRMDWLEVLGLIESVGNRKWGVTNLGKESLKEWSLISPEALESIDFSSVAHHVYSAIGA